MNLKSVAPKKSLGQNFLTDRNIARKTVDLLNIQDGDNVFEIGPGTGALTSILLENNCSLTAIEIDDRAIEQLHKQFPKSKFPNFNLINGDFKKFNFDTDMKDVKVIGNIPYYLSSEIFFKLFESSKNIQCAVMTIQKELAKRLTAKPRTKDYGILTVAMMMSGNCTIEFDVSPQCFYPIPNVWSSVIKMEFTNPPYLVSDYKKSMNLVRTSFHMRRKMLGNSLKSFFQQVDATKIDDIQAQKLSNYSKMRPEELTPEDFEFFVKLFY
jgi:16S rRNA (adenine1518-N6/adenine1519-N6)-dimethyltransferase